MTTGYLSAPAVGCWCGRIEVRPTRALVERGLTRSCGRWNCKPPKGTGRR